MKGSIFRLCNWLALYYSYWLWNCSSSPRVVVVVDAWPQLSTPVLIHKSPAASSASPQHSNHNVTHLLDNLLADYDNHLRPNYGGLFTLTFSTAMDQQDFEGKRERGREEGREREKEKERDDRSGMRMTRALNLGKHFVFSIRNRF